MKIQFKKLALFLAITGLFAYQAGATIAYNFPSSLQGTQVGGPYSLGTVFNVSNAIQVTQLGAFDPNGAAFSGIGVQVGIYKVTLTGSGNSTVLTSGNLVTPVATFTGNQSLFDPGSSTALQNIAPVTLGAGVYMVVANNYGVGGSFKNYNPIYNAGGATTPNAANLTSANVAYGVTYPGSAFFNPSASLAPTIAGWGYDGAGKYYLGSPAAPRYAAGNFNFELSPVPEAGTFSMAGALLLGLIYGARWYSDKRKQLA